LFSVSDEPVMFVCTVGGETETETGRKPVWHVGVCGRTRVGEETRVLVARICAGAIIGW